MAMGRPPTVVMGDYTRRRWSTREPLEGHETWCYAQPPFPAGVCSCPRNRFYPAVRRERERV